MLKGKLKWKTKDVKKSEHKVTDLSKQKQSQTPSQEEPTPELPPDFNAEDQVKAHKTRAEEPSRDAISGEKDRKIQKLREEADQLRTKLEKSKKRVEDISSEKEKLSRANDDLTEKCRDLKERNKSLQDEIDQLREQMKAVSVESPKKSSDPQAPSLPGSATKKQNKAPSSVVTQTPIKTGRKRSNSVATKGFI